MTGIPDDLRAVRERYPFSGSTGWRIRDTGGDGRALLMLPGSLGNADIFFRQVSALSPRVRCIAVDYPDAAPVALADGLAGLMDRLGLRTACVLGSSLAGYWLQTFGARHPGRVAGMVLANSFCDAQELRRHPLFSIPALEAVTGDVLKAEWLARLEARVPDALRDAQIDLLRNGQSGASLRYRLLAAATACPAPVMDGPFAVAVIDCADDPILSRAARDAVAARYPSARRFTLRAGGHYPHVSQAADYNRFVETLLAGWDDGQEAGASRRLGDN